MNYIYVNIPENKLDVFMESNEMGFIKANEVRTDILGNTIAKYEFRQSLDDIRMKYLAYVTIETYLGLGKAVYKSFNKVKDDYYNTLKIIDTNETINDIAETTEATLLLKRPSVIKNFCKKAGIYMINNQPAILTLDPNTKAYENLKEIISKGSTYTEVVPEEKRAFIVGFVNSQADFSLEQQTEVLNFKIDTKQTSAKVSRISSTCDLMKDFINGNNNLNETELKLLLSNIVHLTGGWALYKKKLDLMNIDSNTRKRLEALKTVYTAKGTQYRCKNFNCKYYDKCLNKKLYNTKENLMGRYEQLYPIEYKTPQEAKCILKEEMENIMQNYLEEYNMAIVMVTTGQGKTELFTSWVVEQLKDPKLRPINIIAAPTIKLATEIKEKIEQKLKESVEIEGLDELEEKDLKSIAMSISSVNPFIGDTFKVKYEDGDIEKASSILKNLVVDILSRATIREGSNLFEQRLITKLKDEYKVLYEPKTKIYMTGDIMKILNKIDPELAEKYEFFNRVGAQSIASKMIYSKINEIIEKFTNKKIVSQAEKELMEWQESKFIIEQMKDEEGIYIVTHEWLAIQNNNSKLKGKTIVIDEDIFSSLNKLEELNIGELDLIHMELMTMEQTALVKETIKLVELMKDEFINRTIDVKVAKVPQFRRKDNGGLLDIYDIANRNKTIFDLLAETIYNLRGTIKSNILGVFKAEYIMKYGNSIMYNIRRDLKKDAKFVMFSATADKEIYDRLFTTRKETEGFKVKYIDIGPIKHTGLIEQYVNISGSKTQLNLKDEYNQTNATRLIRKAYEYMGGSVKFITFKNIITDLNKLKDLGEMESYIDIVSDMCIGNASGYDELKGMNTCIIGNLRTPESALLLYAYSLGIDVRDSGQLRYQNVEYKYFKFKYYCYTNNDPLNHLLIWLTDKETRQAIGRSRTVWTNARVLLFSPIPNEEAVIMGDFDIDLIKPNFKKVERTETGNNEVSLTTLSSILKELN